MKLCQSLMSFLNTIIETPLSCFIPTGAWLAVKLIQFFGMILL